MDKIKLSFTLNGEAVSREVDVAARLLDALRLDFGLTGTKEGCGEGECGACTVWLDGLPINSCLTPAFQAEGRDVRTVESVDDDTVEKLNATGTAQCGACTPGIVMTTRWLAAHPETLDIVPARRFMSGNICRCTGYDTILRGVESVIAGGGDANDKCRGGGK